MGLTGLRPSSAAWSPDWRRIVFVGSPPPLGRFAIYLVDVDCVDDPNGCLSSATRLATSSNQPCAHPSWFPDNDRVIYSCGEEMRVVNADGTADQSFQLATGFGPVWSPNGTELAFNSFKGCDPNNTGLLPGIGASVWMVLSNGSGLRCLSNLLPDSGDPAWAPDGEWLAFISAKGGSTREGSPIYIFKARPDGGDITQLTGEGVHGLSPAWSPDGTKIVFQSDAPEGGLMVMNADGTGLTRLTEDETHSEPSWSP